MNFNEMKTPYLVDAVNLLGNMLKGLVEQLKTTLADRLKLTVGFARSLKKKVNQTITDYFSGIKLY